MASRFWVGGAGTWDSTTTTNWSATTGGAGGASAPVAGDTITFDGSSGGGTVTPNSSIDSIAFGSLTAGAFTGTLAFNTNNPNMVFAGTVSLSGTGTRTINLGSGTWTVNVGGTIWDCATTTNLTATFQNAPLSFTGNSTNRVFNGGAKTYNSLTIANNSPTSFFAINQSNTFSSVTVGSGVSVVTTNFQDQTVTGALTMNGTSAAQVGLTGTLNSTTNTTWTVGSASTITWGAIGNITKAGAGSITATNSLDLGRNSGVTITAPSAGGGVVGVIGG